MQGRVGTQYHADKQPRGVKRSFTRKWLSNAKKWRIERETVPHKGVLHLALA